MLLLASKYVTAVNLIPLEEESRECGLCLKMVILGVASGTSSSSWSNDDSDLIVFVEFCQNNGENIDI